MRNRGRIFGGRLLAGTLLGAGLVLFPVLPLIAMTGGAALAQAADGFVEGFEDLPLMPGLSSVAGSAVSFDSPYGRIVESVVRGRLQKAAVVSFYDRTLPQLGWVRSAGGDFRREGEILTLDIHDRGPVVEVRFQVSPTG